MIKRAFRQAAVLLSAVCSSLLLLSTAALSADRDAFFFRSVQGAWVGPGEIVAGKYKGTKFTCTLTGEAPEGKIGMSLDGSCRVGIFSQRMSAMIERNGRTYRGTFLDGAAGKGLDIVSGNVKGDKVVMALNRNKLNGAMLATMKGPDTMNVTVSVRVDETLVPVIGMNLRRVEGTEVARD
jgi:hypothetical protein